MNSMSKKKIAFGVLCAAFLTAVVVTFTSFSNKSEATDNGGDNGTVDLTGDVSTDTLTNESNTEETADTDSSPKTGSETPQSTEPKDDGSDTLAPVEVPDDDTKDVLDDNDMDVEQTEPKPQTAPPAEEQRKPDETKYEDGIKYIWHPDFGWVKDSEDGQVIVMDVEGDGEKYEGGW